MFIVFFGLLLQRYVFYGNYGYKNTILLCYVLIPKVKEVFLFQNKYKPYETFI